MKKGQFIAIAIILLITAVLIGVEQYLYNDTTPTDWNVTALRSGEMVFDIPDPNGDKSPLKNYKQTRAVKAGEKFRVLGHRDDLLWVEAENGDRGMIDQVLVADTVVTVCAAETYPEGRKMLVETVDPETHSLGLRDFSGKKYKISRSYEVRTMDVLRNPLLRVRRMGYGWVRGEVFDDMVVGTSLAELDTTFAPVLFRYADRAVLSRRVYDSEERALFLPVLQVNANGVVTRVITYFRPIEEFSRLRSWILGLPGADFLLDNGQRFMDAGGGLYERDDSHSDVSRRICKGRDSEITPRSAMGKFFGFIGKILFGLFVLSLACWYYGVTIFLVPVLLIQVARSPEPFKRLSNEQLQKVFEWVSYPFFYVALLVTAADLSNNLFFNVAVVFGTFYVIYMVASSLVSNRCPDCKHTFCFDLQKTEWGKNYYTSEIVEESHEVGEKYVGSDKHYKEITVDGKPVLNTDVVFTDHYDVTIRHDQYKVTYEHQDGRDHWECRYCGHVKTSKAHEKREFSRELVGSYETHISRSYERDARDEMR